MPHKRSRNDEEETRTKEKSQKRTKQDISVPCPADLVDEMEEVMNRLQLLPPEFHIHPSMFRIPRNLLEPGTSQETLTDRLKAFKNYCQDLRILVSAEINETQGEDRIQKRKRRKLKVSEYDLREVISMADELRGALLSKPSPSSYAHASTWKQFQNYPRPILCLRPTDKHGLPLPLLHRIFTQFQRLSRQSLPTSVAGANALRVASGLCSCMGDGFTDKTARGKAFDNMVGNILQGVNGKTQLVGNDINGDADRIYRVNGRCMIIRVDRVEMGESGDPYTHVARAYDLACERMEENGITLDAPVFLLCVMGPSLMITGGFKDGEHTVVEPLCPILFMLTDRDNVNGRSVQLATHLFALRTCLEQLPNLPNPASTISGMPRIFPSFRDAEGVEHTLTFLRRLDPDLLLFNAMDENSQEVCAKIIYGPYGEDVHRLLSNEGMAPKLFGVSRIDDGPTMIVMEMLDDPWETLYTFAQFYSRWTEDGVQPAIRKRLGEILARLAAKVFVHGDFRANNIMVKPGEEELAVLIDFDWAGEAGKVHYPLDRNELLGIRWPGEPASAISVAHDQSMLRTQWASLLNPATFVAPFYV